MTKQKHLLNHIPLAVAACLILYFAVLREQSFLKTLPTLITLVVQVLLVTANRYAFLLGGTNALLYTFVYLTDRLYFSAVSALFISFPVQIFSFFHWGRHKTEKNRTALKALSRAKRMLFLCILLVGYCICFFGLSRFFTDAVYPQLDILCFTLGTAVTFLSALRFIESQYVSLCSSVIQTIMRILITADSPENCNYVIISVYNCFRITQAVIGWTKQYLAQKTRSEQHEIKTDL